MKEKAEQELLSTYAKQRCEACFSELVRRQVDLVYSAAVRLTGDPHMAQDVTQSVFVALAQQAATVANKLAKGTPLSGWLHLTTRNIAAKTIRSEVRRRARENEALEMNELSANQTEAVWDRIVPHLDHALEDLPEPDRHALLLRFFEGRSAREIGLRLGLTEEAAQKRVTRALGRLRTRLVARGVSAASFVSATSLALVLEGQVVQSAPPALAATLTKAAMITTTATVPTSGTVSAKTFASVAMTKSQTCILTALIVAITIPVGFQHSQLKTLRMSLANTAAPTLPGQVAQNEQQPVPPSASVEAETARLTRLRDDLRNRIQKQRGSQSRTSVLAGMAPGPVLLRPGQRISLKELGFAGNTTPEAALQSSLVFARDGDLEKFLHLALVPPDKVDKINAVLGSPQESEKMKQALAEMLQGVVQESSVQVGPAHEIIGTSQGKKYPDNPSGIVALEITEKRQIDEHRVELLVKMIRGSDTRTETISLGLTSSGWKQMMRL